MIDNIGVSEIEKMQNEIDTIGRAVSHGNMLTNINTAFLAKFNYGTDNNNNIVDMELSKDLLEHLYSALIDGHEKLVQEQQKQEEEMRHKFNENSVKMIKRVKYDNPWTIVFWADGAITKAKCHENDAWSEAAGLNACIAKHFFQTAGAYNKVMKTYCHEENCFNSWDDGYDEGYAMGYKQCSMDMED